MPEWREFPSQPFRAFSTETRPWLRRPGKSAACSPGQRFSGNWKLSGRPLVALITSRWNVSNIQPHLIEEVADELERYDFQYEIIPLAHLSLLENLPVSGIVSLVTRDELPPEWHPDVPTVMLNAEENRAENFYSVYSDIAHGFELAVEHFYELGHRRIALATRGLNVFLENGARRPSGPRYAGTAISRESSQPNGSRSPDF